MATVLGASAFAASGIATRPPLVAGSMLASAVPASSFVVDTDCGLDDLATLALASAANAPIRLVTTVSGLATPGFGHQITSCFLRSIEMAQLPVVGGAEEPPTYVAAVRKKADWEISYSGRLTEATARVMTPIDVVKGVPIEGTAAAAADAIIEHARTDGPTTVLALGALTNLAAAVQRSWEGEFQKLVKRVIFIGDTDPSRRSYNVALDPDALRTLLRSGVEIILIGQACYAPPSWVAAHTQSCADAPHPSCVAARAVRELSDADPYSLCYDPLALFFHLHEDAFDVEWARIPVRVTPGLEWRFERCQEEQRDGYVIEPSSVDLARYADFLKTSRS